MDEFGSAGSLVVVVTVRGAWIEGSGDRGRGTGAVPGQVAYERLWGWPRRITVLQQHYSYGTAECSSATGTPIVAGTPMSGT
jgi:hypothetical protein